MHLLCIGLLCFIVGDSTWNDWLIDWLVSTCSVWKGRKSTGNQLVECSMSSSQKCQWLIAKYYSFVSGVLSVVREFMQIMFVRELHSSCYWCKSSTLFQKICELLRFITQKKYICGLWYGIFFQCVATESMLQKGWLCTPKNIWLWQSLE